MAYSSSEVRLSKPAVDKAAPGGARTKGRRISRLVAGATPEVDPQGSSRIDPARPTSTNLRTPRLVWLAGTLQPFRIFGNPHFAVCSAKGRPKLPAPLVTLERAIPSHSKEYPLLVVLRARRCSHAAAVVLIDLGRFVVLAAHSRRALAAENLFLRKQLALFQERRVKPARADDRPAGSWRQ